MKLLLRRLWEEPVLAAVVLLTLIRRFVIPLVNGEPLGYDAVDGFEDALSVLVGGVARGLVSPTTKLRRLARERNRNYLGTRGL